MTVAQADGMGVQFCEQVVVADTQDQPHHRRRAGTANRHGGDTGIERLFHRLRTDEMYVGVGAPAAGKMSQGTRS